MLKVASKYLGVGPKDCMHTAEQLYLKSYISYPRTESTQYPVHYDLKYINIYFIFSIEVQ